MDRSKRKGSTTPMISGRQIKLPFPDRGRGRKELSNAGKNLCAFEAAIKEQDVCSSWERWRVRGSVMHFGGDDESE